MWHVRESSSRYDNRANLYIKNIPIKTSPREFFEYFLKFGDIVSAKLNEDEFGTHLGYGYVHFESDESAKKCIAECDNQEIWENSGSKIKIEPFQKRNERSTLMVGNKTLFVKDFPQEYEEENIKRLFKDFKVSWVKIFNTLKGKNAIVTLENEDMAIEAKKLNGLEIANNKIFVDSIMSRQERDRFLESKIKDQISILTHNFRENNLHVRNLPQNLSESDFRKVFEKFGTIKSVKVQVTKYITKEKGQMVEKSYNSGVGYVCFTDTSSAKLAKDEMNNKKIPGFESSSRPLLIEYFMSKNERKTQYIQSTKLGNHGNMFYGKNNYMNNMNNYDNMNNVRMINQEGYLRNPVPPMINIQTNQGSQGLTQTHHSKKDDRMKIQHQQKNENIPDPDIEKINRMEDDSSKREYLGEFIFKRIELHPITEEKKITFDEIGKITGMILGIEDINEVLDICKNFNHLSSRIMEALELLDSQKVS